MESNLYAAGQRSKGARPAERDLLEVTADHFLFKSNFTKKAIKILLEIPALLRRLLLDEFVASFIQKFDCAQDDPQRRLGASQEVVLLRFGAPMASLRLGHAMALTARRIVIHYRVAASLPTREAFC